MGRAFLLFTLASMPLLAACAANQGVVKLALGEWKGPAGEIKARGCLTLPLDPKKVESSRPGRLEVLTPEGAKLTLECAGKCAAAKLATTPPTPALGLFARTGRAMSGQPEFVSSSSRSVGWSDAVVPLTGSGSQLSADLAAVFAGDSGPEKGAMDDIRVCPLDKAQPCAFPPRRVIWDGSKAPLTAPDLVPGAYRLTKGGIRSLAGVLSQESQEAWIRIVPEADLAAFRASYAADLETLKQLPPDELWEEHRTGAGARVLRRAVLATTTGGR
jgi:hypothetical protein